jgi:alpha-N-acetylglucosaminidase
MKFANYGFATCLAVLISTVTALAAPSTAGIEALVRRRIPDHADNFQFALVDNSTTGTHNTSSNDAYTVADLSNGTIRVEGTTLSALATGLHRYLADTALVDINWFIGSQLHFAPAKLPHLKHPLQGSSIVPWRYHFNTVTFSYTSAFWTWDDWETELDWLALRGVNLALAWNGYEKILIDVYREIGLSDSDIADFLSGPAYQAWNRFGNIQGSWGGNIPFDWVDSQFELQKKIVARMVELGITPVLPAFTGFVPEAFMKKFPNAATLNGSQWEEFPSQYTNDTFLEPSEPMFSELQSKVIAKQNLAFGNVTNIYTLDQFNENNPSSGDASFLRNISYNTWKSLKAADTDAIWMMQGWLFFSNQDFWTNERVEAFLSGVETDTDMLILDLFSESQPQWQRLNSYYGKPWIWCQLHDYGGNMGLYGQISNVTVDPIAALSNASNMIGMGLTMEGQEGNEIMYSLLLDQAWSSAPIDTASYFQSWATARYSAGGRYLLPKEVHQAWEILRESAYNNTNITAAQATTKSILELSPNATGLLNRTGHHPTTITYDPSAVVSAWKLLLKATRSEPSLWNNVAYAFDLADVTRQVLANAFVPLYTDFLSSALPQPSMRSFAAGRKLVNLLDSLDRLLNAAHPAFHLSTWLDAARTSASTAAAGNASAAQLYSYDARNQLTLWGPDGEISDYASKQWAGLVGGYYLPRWQKFVDAYVKGNVSQATLAKEILEFEESWQNNPQTVARGGTQTLKEVLKQIEREWSHTLNNATAV